MSNSNLPPFIRELNEQMEGWPSATLSIFLVTAAVIILMVALFGSNFVKALVLAWIVLP